MSKQIVSEGTMIGLEDAAKAATKGPHHIYTNPRDDNNHKANAWFIDNCYPQYVLELIDRVRAAEAEVAGHRNMLKGEGLRLTAGDVMVITLAQRHLQFGAQWEHYRKGLLSTLPPGVNAFIVSEGVSMSVLTDDELAKAGLMRKTDQDWSDAGSPAPTPEDYRDLQAKFDQLQTELFNERKKSADLSKQNGRILGERCHVEQHLMDVATNKKPIPNRQDCRILALRLGTPKSQWNEALKGHQFGDAIAEMTKEPE